MQRYTVAHVGLGHRGRNHIEGFLANPDRFELKALCDLNQERLQQGAEDYGPVATYTDADRMLAETKPDVFCFATLPDVRLSLAELGAKHSVKAMALEKPMATSLAEAWAITDLCREHKIKAVVSHQQKYLTSMQKLKEIADSGAIGDISNIHATALASLSQLGTHYTDYTLWVNRGARARWVIGHIHGKKGLDASHPSPDHVLAQVLFDNGVRAFMEYGYLSPSHMDHRPEKFSVDNRLTVYGTHGYAWADTDGRWGAFTRQSHGEVIVETGENWGIQSRTRLQPLYLKDLADWLDDDQKVHPCNIEVAYHGYEIMEAICLSALNHTRVDLPWADPQASPSILDRMRRELPEVAPPANSGN